MKTQHLKLTTAVAACVTLLAAPALAAPAYDWTGFYGGLNLAVGTGAATWSDIVVPSDTQQNLAGPFARQSFTGIGGGAQAGYLYQRGRYVAGLEGRIGYADITGSTDCIGGYGDFHAACQTKIGWNGDVLARVGLTPVDRGLIYVTGGVAWAHTQFQPVGEHGFSPTTGYAVTNRDPVGYLVGGGVEYALLDRWTVGVEYAYKDFGHHSVDFAPAGAQNDYNPPFSIQAGTHYSTLMLRVNHRF